MRKRCLIISILVLLVIAAGVALQVDAQTSWEPLAFTKVSRAEHVKWVSDSLEEMLTIKPGMKRSDLLKVFTTEGGISTVTQRQYVYRNCRYFKVEVKFTPAYPTYGDQGRLTSRENPDDVIKSISKPYIEYTICD